MYRSSITIAIVAIGTLCCSTPGFSEQTKEPARRQQSQSGKKAPAADKQASLSGCVDQQDGKYVLISDQSRELIAQLEADGFETEGFAKHLGHKVTVRGTRSSNGTERPIFRVRSVETQSDSCGQLELH